VVLFPLQMTKAWHRVLQVVVGYPQPWEDHVDNVATSFYLRGLAQNVTMVGFLGKWLRLWLREFQSDLLTKIGWLTILHFGPNSRWSHLPLSPRRQIADLVAEIYPFFRFSPTPEDPYTFQMTFIASCVIWVSHRQRTRRPRTMLASKAKRRIHVQGTELLSSFVARRVMSLAFKVDVSQVGMDEMREYPELGECR
jgi:hypothetical protein